RTCRARGPALVLRLSAGPASLPVDTDQGGRIASLVVAGRELLVTSGFGPFGWGSSPMAPFAGRLRNPRLAFAGRTYELPANEAPHALHGLVFERPWETLDHEAAAVTIACELGPPWPVARRGRQVVA